MNWFSGVLFVSCVAAAAAEGPTCTNCDADHGLCMAAETCVCDRGYGGIDCSTACTSAADPMNYTCSTNATCLSTAGDTCSDCTPCEANEFCITKNDQPFCWDCSCENEGSCMWSAEGKVTCSCPPNFAGNKCEHQCDPGCVNGTCVLNEAMDAAECSCTAMYVGNTCDTPCPACVNGTCGYDEVESEASCSCDEGYTGELCDTQLCSDTVLCQNGGVCQNDTWTCACAEGYEGDLCQTESSATAVLSEILLIGMASILVLMPQLF